MNRSHLLVSSLQNRNLQAEPCDRPNTRSKCGLSRCQPMPTPTSYSVQGPDQSITCAAESFDLLDDRDQPVGDRICLLELAHAIVVSKFERGHAAVAFVLAELERLQRQSPDMADQGPLHRLRDEFLGISQTFRPRQPVTKETVLLGQATFLLRVMEGGTWH